MADEEQQIVAFLSQPAAYGLPVGEKIGHVETHASHVFLAGDRAYKLKKRVKFTFLDFSTLERRRAACENEIELNRRTAPDIYLRILPLTRRGDGFHLGGEEGELADWLVEMKRFPASGLYAAKAGRGELALSEVEELAEAAAAFHRRAEVARDAGGAENFLKIVEGSAEDMKPLLGKVLDAGLADRVTARSRELAGAHRALLDRRRAEGRVRHCHGDLHLGNVTDIGGHPVIFDCIEFSDRIARIDVLYDLAFLLMDLAFRAERDPHLEGFANRAFNTWLDRLPQGEAESEMEGLALLPLFMATRAVVRAKVTAAQAKDDAAKERANAYLQFAGKLLEPLPPHLAAIGGLSGTGKSTVARGLAARIGGATGAVHLRSDIIRKRMFGAGPLDRLPEAAYAPGAGERVYGEMLKLAGHALDAGMSVVMDAVFAREGERGRAGLLASSHGAAFTGIWLEAPLDVLEARVAAREARGDDPSDAGLAVLRRQLSYDIGKMDWTRIDASGTPDEVLKAALAPARAFH
ncbi:MAG: AAA family ATPase [Parvibaculaceae bacterium]|nr:AAA family ATPase [Parvibaculaceae bacterium]